MVLQSRKNNISKVILGGMLANLCVESHMRDFIEQGFQVAVVTDAVAAPNHPEWETGMSRRLSITGSLPTRCTPPIKPWRR